jgi:hypothetical protein
MAEIEEGIIGVTARKIRNMVTRLFHQYSESRMTASKRRPMMKMVVTKKKI